jgi:hypothetical protein
MLKVEINRETWVIFRLADNGNGRKNLEIESSSYEKGRGVT